MAHANTILHQALSLISRPEFDALAKEHSMGRRSRVFSRWTQFTCVKSLSCEKSP